MQFSDNVSFKLVRRGSFFSWGTKYVPIGVPSILASLLLFVPLFVAFGENQRVREE